MNKISMVVLPVVFVLFGSSVFAQNTSSYDNSADAQRLMQAKYRSANPMGMYPTGMEKEKIEKFIQSLLEMGLEYDMLEKPTMVSTEDGVVVAYGDTLRKYDKDLNVVKEVTMDVDVDGMQDLASKFAKKYTADLMDLMTPAAGTPGASVSSSPSATATDSNAADSNKTLYDQREEEIKKEIDQMK
jgi:hypothetical protein